jgi:hypothetical protein
MGRIEALSSYAETNCGYNPAGARGPETAIVEHIARLQAECAMLRAKETLLLASGEFISALGYAGDLNAVAATMWLAEHDKQVESDADHKWIGYVKKHLSGLHPSIETYEDAAQAIKRAGEGSTKAWRAGAFAMRNIYQGYGKGVYNIPEPPAPERSTE